MIYQIRIELRIAKANVRRITTANLYSLLPLTTTDTSNRSINFAKRN